MNRKSRRMAYSTSQDRDQYPVNEDAKHDTIKVMESLESMGAPWDIALMEKKAMNRFSRIAEKVAAFGIRDMSGPKPLFEMGDIVKTWDPRLTEIWSVGDYDESVGGRRYVVMDPKTHRKLNIMEKDIVKVAKDLTAAEIVGFGTAFGEFLEYCQKMRAEYYKKQYPNNPLDTLEPMTGARWVRIVTVSEGQGRSAWAFVDRTNGDVMKPAGWSAPAKHARANIFDKASWRNVTAYGPAYLR